MLLMLGAAVLQHAVESVDKERHSMSTGAGVRQRVKSNSAVGRCSTSATHVENNGPHMNIATDEQRNLGSSV